MAQSKSNIQIPIKVLVDKQQDRVLFAEANNEFVDILFSFLTMPMGTIVRLLSKHSNSSEQQPIGSFFNIYTSLVNLENKYFETQACKDLLLNTRNSAEDMCRKLKINIDDIKPTGYYTCRDSNCSGYLSFYKNVKCKKCSKFLNRAVNYKSPWISAGLGGEEGVFVSETASFVITDHLFVIPNIPASTFGILEGYGSTDLEKFEEKTFNIGFTEILDLLKYSFTSDTPLSAWVLGKNYPRLDKLLQTINCPVSVDCAVSFKKITVKLLVQKSSNRILLAFCSRDFVDFLFKLLTVPLGRVISLLSDHYDPAFCVENIFQSVSDLNVGEFFKSKETKDMLLCPRLAMVYQCSNQLFPFMEERIKKFYINKKLIYPGQSCYETPYYLTRDPASATHELKLESPFCDEVLIGSAMFLVTDDLEVTPLSSMSCIKYLQSRNISPTDTEEHVIDIGMKEAVNLLRASLISTSVLRNGLKHLLCSKPKTERKMKKLKLEE